MLAFISLFLPPVLLVCTECRCFAKKWTKWQYLTAYLLSVAILNGIMFLILSFVFKNTESLVSKLNQYTNFAAKYIGLSMILAVTLPVVCRFIQKNIHISLGNKFSFKYWHFAAFSYGVILFMLNLIRIFDNNFWGDEAFSIRLSKMSFTEMISATARDVHPPLYYIIVQFFCKLMGYTGSVYHLASLFPYGILLILSLTWIWKWFGKRTCIILITFASIVSTAVTYNVEVRMYSWGELFILISFLSLYGILTRNHIKYYTLFFLSSLAAAYTHYYCLISVAFFYFILLLWALKKPGTYLLKTLLICILTVAGYLPWFFILLKSLKRTSENYWMTVIPSFRECLEYVFSGKYQKYFLAILVFGVIFFVLYEQKILVIEKKQKEISIYIGASGKDISENTVWIFAGILSVLGTITVGILISTILRPMFTFRYIFPVSVVAWLLCGFCVSRCKGGIIYTILITGMLLTSCFPQYMRTYLDEKAKNNRLHETLAATTGLIGDNDIILTNHSHLSWTILEYYYPGRKYPLIDLSKMPELDSINHYWMVLNCDISEETRNLLAEMDYDCKEIVHQGNLGTHTVCIYNLTKDEEK